MKEPWEDMHLRFYGNRTSSDKTEGEPRNHAPGVFAKPFNSAVSFFNPTDAGREGGVHSHKQPPESCSSADSNLMQPQHPTSDPPPERFPVRTATYDLTLEDLGQYRGDKDGVSSTFPFHPHLSSLLLRPALL